MIIKEEKQFYQGVANAFEESNYNLSAPLLGCGGCFDLVAKKRALLILVKMLINVDSLREHQAYELRKFASMIAAYPLIIGKKIRNSNEIEDGVVYSRYDIPTVSLNTLRNVLLKNLPPLIYAHRGGFKVKFDGMLLQKKRLESELSLGDLAQAIGVSKRTIYEYERGTVDVSLETALKLEEFFDEAFSLAINLFEQMSKIGSITTPSSKKSEPKTELEREVKEHFDTIGFRDQLWMKKIPFRVLARPTPSSKGIVKHPTTITGIAKKIDSEEIFRNIQITYNVSRLAEADPLVVVGSGTKKTEIEGVPIISIDELSKREKEKQEDEES